MKKSLEDKNVVYIPLLWSKNKDQIFFIKNLN